MVWPRCLLTAVSATALLLAAGCASSTADSGSTLRVVTSTDVYGDIVRAVAGEHADVSSIIDNPAQDPHSYVANARTQLSIAKADVIVENGGGYDDFVDRMRSASGRADAVVINAVRLSGKTAPKGGDLNEHVWYDLPSMTKLVTRVVSVLAAKDPRDRAGFRRNAARFASGLRALEQTEAMIRAMHAGVGVAITEPVPLYLLSACGLVNRTPPAFTEAVEAGNDVSATVLRSTLALFSSGAVKVLVYNEQTSGAETMKALAAAKAAGIATVPVTETLPSGQHYLSWMRANLDALDSALSS